MYRQVLANEATASRRRVTFHLVDATDGITAETGEAAGQPQVSDDGAAWTNTGIGTLSSVGSGEYTADLTQTIVATAGHFIRTRYKSAATAEARGTTVQVVAFDPHSTSMGLLLAAANLSADTITDTKIATGAITAAKFAANAITSTVIAADAIGASQIAADAIGSSELAASAVTEIRSQASGTSDSGSTTTMVDAARTEADTDYWKGALILFTSGTITGQCRLITGFNAATDTITFAPATTQAVATQTYEILPAGAVDVRLWNGTAPNDLISGRVDASVGAMAANVVTSSAIAADAIGASQLAANAIGSSELATSAVDEIVDQVWDEIAGTHAAPGSTGSLVSLLTTIDSNVSNVFTQTTILNDATFITTSTVQTGSTSTVVRTTRAEASGYHDNATIVVGNSGVSAVRRIKSYAQTNGAFTVDALPFTPSVGQTVWIIARVAPLSSGSIAAGVWDEARAGHVAAGSFGEGVASVQGNVTGSVASVTGAVGSVAAGGITAASIATDAIDSDAIAASAVTEIQAGLATSAALATVQADTDDIQARLPATLNGGRMRSHVEVMDAGTITAAVIATGAVDADALATDAVTEITVAVDAAVTASHGVGSYVDSGTPPTVGAIADQVWDEVLAGHLTPGSTGFALDAAAAGGAGLTAQQVRDAMKLTPTAGAPAAGSVDEHLDDILADTAAMQPLIDVATSTRATDAGVDAAVTASHGVGSYVDTGAAPSAASVADAVWDEATAGHAIVGSTGEALTQAATGGSAPTVGQIADGVWDELLAGHAIVGSTGEALTDAAAGGAGLTPQQVADALKLAPAAGAPAAGSVYGQLDDIETCACSGGNGDSDVNVEGI